MGNKSLIFSALLTIPALLGLTSFIILMAKYDDFDNKNDIDISNQTDILDWSNELYVSYDSIILYGINKGPGLINDPIFQSLIFNFLDIYFTPSYRIEYNMGNIKFNVHNNLTALIFFTYLSDAKAYSSWVSYNRLKDSSTINANIYSMKVIINHSDKMDIFFLFAGNVELDIVGYKASLMTINIDNIILLNSNYTYLN